MSLAVFLEKKNSENPIKRFSIDWADNNYFCRLAINWPLHNSFYTFYWNSQSSNPS